MEELPRRQSPVGIGMYVCVPVAPSRRSSPCPSLRTRSRSASPFHCPVWILCCMAGARPARDLRIGQALSERLNRSRAEKATVEEGKEATDTVQTPMTSQMLLVTPESPPLLRPDSSASGATITHSLTSYHNLSTTTALSLSLSLFLSLFFSLSLSLSLSLSSYAAACLRAAITHASRATHSTRAITLWN